MTTPEPGPAAVPEHVVTEHWDHEGGDVLWRTCSCGERWTRDEKRCPGGDGWDTGLDPVHAVDDIATLRAPKPMDGSEFARWHAAVTSTRHDDPDPAALLARVRELAEQAAGAKSLGAARVLAGRIVQTLDGSGDQAPVVATLLARLDEIDRETWSDPPERGGYISTGEARWLLGVDTKET